MAPMGGSQGQPAWKGGQASGFTWASSSPTPAQVAAMEACFPEVIRIPGDLLNEASRGWKETAVLVRTFQRWVAPEVFIREFRRGGVAGSIQPLSLAHRCHIFRFENEEARNMVLGRPWIVNGQPVASEAWRPEFVPAEDSVSSALLWVRLPSLPVEFWSETVLRQILVQVGEFEFVDEATRLLSRGGFARACIRVDLRHPLRPGVRVQGTGSPFWQSFQFEQLEGICELCGSIHLTGPCSQSSPSPASVKPPVDRCFGPWMAAVRRRRQQEAVKKNPSKAPGASNAIPKSPASAAVQPDPADGGWLIPSKPARRCSSSSGKGGSREARVSAPVIGRQMQSIESKAKDSCEMSIVPVSCGRAGSKVTVEAESNLQGTEAELQTDNNQIVKLSNPFGLLAMGNKNGGYSTQRDANPGPSKRARPEEAQPMRIAPKRDSRKGKGTVSLSKEQKGKSAVEGSQGPVQDPSAFVIFEGSHKGVTVVSGPTVEGPKAAECTGVIVVQRIDDPSTDCTMQLDTGDTLPPGQLADSLMRENQGGLHPHPQV